MEKITNTDNSENLRSCWRGRIAYGWTLGLVLMLIICVSRFFLVLQANKSGSYFTIGIIMIVSAIIPYIFLSKNGRRNTGIKKPTNYLWILYSFIIGAVFSLALYYIGYKLYGTTVYNWYAYIGRINLLPDYDSRFIPFIISSIVGMTFSPIGEELFFRGFINGCFAVTYGSQKGSIIDSIAFALTHLSHFGIVFAFGSWHFFLLPSLIWVSAMFLVSVIFFECKKRSGSILGAIVCHSAFNLFMFYSVYYLF